MRREIMRSAAILCIGAAAITSAARADVTFSDMIFPDANWPMVQLTGTGSSSSAQILTGGNPNEARQITTTVSAGSPSSIFAFHQYGSTTATIYTPSTQGAITSIIASMDYLAVNGQQNLAFGLKQSNIFYYAAPVLATDAAAYHADAAALTAASFVRVDGLAGNPNFATGASIRFGVMSLNATGADGLGFTTVADIDNWSVHLIPSPAPLALVALAALRRRR
jgi:hypothetical protein